MMNVLVTMRVVDCFEYREKRDALSHDWGKLFQEMGIVPVVVPNSLEDPTPYLTGFGARGLILTGGDDLGLGPEEAGGPRLGVRDRVEGRLVGGALEKGMPVLGICRGLQFINRYLGGTLTRRLPAGHAGTPHRVSIVEGVAGIDENSTAMVNSFHEHGLLVADVAPELAPFAVSDDGVVEGVYHPDLPVLGIQWHPERPNAAGQLDKVLLEYWVRRCA